MSEELPGPAGGDASGETAESWAPAPAAPIGAADRDKLVECARSSLAADGVGGLRLIAAAADFGERRASAGGSVSELLNALEAVEEQLLERIGAGAWRAASALRRAALAGFSRAVDRVHRERMSAMRHDIANAVGTVRNAILLAEEEMDEHAREHFLNIAKRNATNAETLIQSLLAHSPLAAALVGGDIVVDIQLAADRSRDRLMDEMRAEADVLGLELRSADDGRLEVLIRPSGRQTLHDVGGARQRDDVQAQGF